MDFDNLLIFSFLFFFATWKWLSIQIFLNWNSVIWKLDLWEKVKKKNRNFNLSCLTNEMFWYYNWISSLSIFGCEGLWVIKYDENKSGFLRSWQSSLLVGFEELIEMEQNCKKLWIAELKNIIQQIFFLHSISQCQNANGCHYGKAERNKKILN